MTNNTTFSIALAVIGAILVRVANFAWNDLWAKIFELVAQAEVLYYSEEGAKRKDWVSTQVMSWANDNLKLNAIERGILKFAMGILIDSLVRAINDALGHDWVAKAKEIEARLSDILPVIE